MMIRRDWHGRMLSLQMQCGCGCSRN